jgi:hypothetical protein
VAQITDAIVLGFAKSGLLAKQSLAPLRLLKQEGHLRDIHYVTWDSPEIDPFVAPVLAMPEVRVTRLPQPAVKGTAEQKTLVYQNHNLDVALPLVAEDDTVVLKSRPDVVIKADFLRSKIVNFARDCGTVPTAALGVAMPKPVLRNKIWTPWADSNQPFFYEDATFMGRKDDLRNFVIPITRSDLALLDVPMCDHYYHIVRFAKPFLESHPLFQDYLRHYRHFTSNMDYRIELMQRVQSEAFIFYLLIAHAWILYSQLHVDCGALGDILFYPNTRNRKTDWSDPKAWRQALPYEDVDGWRQTESAGSIVANIGRPFGRLVSDAWQTALFEKENSELPHSTLVPMLEHIAQCADGRLKPLEKAFYENLAQFHRHYMHNHQPPKRAATPVMGAAALSTWAGTR